MPKNDLSKNILNMKSSLDDQMFDQCKEVSYILISVVVAQLQITMTRGYLEAYIKYNL